MHIRAAGLTLLELVNSLAIGAILLSVAVPGYQLLISRNLISDARNRFLAHLQFARHTAIMRNERVALCPSPDAQQCLYDHKKWHSGYMVFLDLDQNRRRDNQEPVLRYQKAYPEGISIQSSSRFRQSINYRPDGTAWGSNTTLLFCDNNNQTLNRKIALLGTGRARAESAEEKKLILNCS